MCSLRALHVPDSPDYILGMAQTSQCNGEWRCLLPCRAPRRGEGYTKYLASSLERRQWRMEAGRAARSTHASHFITDYCWAGGMGNAEWRKRDASCSLGQGSCGNDQLGVANAPFSAMEWTMTPGKTQSKL